MAKRKRLMIVLFNALVALPWLTPRAFAQCTATSPTRTVALVELYTSEGCDSCPAADRWLSALPTRQRDLLFVPLALHVDYWDRLGWRDRFARPDFTARQQEEARRRSGAFVYTPQVVLQGRDYAGWRAADVGTDIAAINRRPARAVIVLSIHGDEGPSARVDVDVEVPDVHDRRHASVSVALVQSGLRSEVTRGENAGKRLSHDFVARVWHTSLDVPQDGHLRRSVELGVPADGGALELVAFVENVMTGDLLQALALPFCDHVAAAP